MSPTALSRRSLLQMASAATAATLLPGTSQAPAQAQTSGQSLLGDAEAFLNSIAKAYSFQSLMMDAYATGATVRLAQSYSDEALGATAFTYDNAVAIHAYLARGTADDVVRAQILGSGLLYAQANNFPFADGRFAQGYYVNTPAADGSGDFFFNDSATY